MPITVLSASAVTVSIFRFAVGFGQFNKIKTAVNGRFLFLWFQILITRIANSETQRTDNYISIVSQLILGVSYQIVWASVVSGKTQYYVPHCRFGSC